MTKQDFYSILDETDTPDFCCPNHQRMLRVAIVNRGEQRFSMMRWLHRGGDYFMQHRYAVTGVGVSMAVGIVMLASQVTGDSLSPREVQAQEVVQQMQTGVQNLPMDRRKNVEERINADLLLAIQELQEAVDVAYYSRQQLRYLPPVPTQSPRRQHQVHYIEIPAQSASVKFLRYTNTAGEEVILGLDEHNVPTMRIVRFAVGSN